MTAQIRRSQFTWQSKGASSMSAPAIPSMVPVEPTVCSPERCRSRALARMSKNEEDVSPSLDGLSEKEMGVLNDWEKKFEAKAPPVSLYVSLNAPLDR
ncbi:hypothetical protein HAX54_035158 [Datura stramonium]|uniref:Uncharacterized protein n=1 Tax=Datura stramonium TaxID=4076 RepID=A0ABS8SFD8_DATST|nr:hypothetical protein [Datura stramonium]